MPRLYAPWSLVDAIAELDLSNEGQPRLLAPIKFSHTTIHPAPTVPAANMVSASRDPAHSVGKQNSANGGGAIMRRRGEMMHLRMVPLIRD